MNRAILIVTLLTATHALAQDRAAVQAQADQLGSTLCERVSALRQTPQAQALEKAVEAAKADYEATEAGLPGVPELDAQLRQCLDQIRALREKRNELLRKNEALLEAKRRAVEAAEAAGANAVFGDAQVKELIAQRQALAKQLDAVAVAPALPVPAPVEKQP